VTDDDVDRILADLDDRIQRVRTYARGVRLAKHDGDTELVRALLELIQSEFE
jgi:hypothetical protein